MFVGINIYVGVNAMTTLRNKGFSLNLWKTKQKPARTGQGGTQPILPVAAIRTDSDGNLTCFGKPIMPQFRHARDLDGQMLFVALWRCSGSGRITF